MLYKVKISNVSMDAQELLRPSLFFPIVPQKWDWHPECNYGKGSRDGTMLC